MKSQCPLKKSIKEAQMLENQLEIFYKRNGVVGIKAATGNTFIKQIAYLHPCSKPGEGWQLSLADKNGPANDHRDKDYYGLLRILVLEYHIDLVKAEIWPLKTDKQLNKTSAY